MSDAAPPPLLRSPPFPWVSGAVAAVSSARAATQPGDVDVDAVLNRLAAVRVGGAFWGSPVESACRTIVRPRDAADVERLAGRAADAVWIAGRRRLAARMRRRGLAVIAGEPDPWSLLRPGIRLLAHGDDEWAAIAAIVGADVAIVSDGRFGDRGEPRDSVRARAADAVAATTYRDPFTGRPCDWRDAVALLGLWRDVLDANRPIVAATGMAWWKRAEIRRFLWAPRAAPLRFARSGTAIRMAARRGGSLAVWPSRIDARSVAAAARASVPLTQVEDGFVRSAGLGADLVPPLSVVVDPIGIHYDPGRASRLEQLLETADLPPPLIARAAALRRVIVENAIGKYGADGSAALPPRPPNRRLVLVPGQVEDDLSVVRGGSAVAGNLDLLRRVRAAEPDAAIWYRPHPDVDAGHRRGHVDDRAALAHVDRVVRGGGMAALLMQVDAVHVLTSLTGFEALLRGREVACHGTPFYAGWGLTRDLGPVPARRRRRRTIDELAAVTLILYPRYLDPATMLPCPPEVLIARLGERHAPTSSLLIALRRLQGRALARRAASRPQDALAHRGASAEG